MRNYGYFHRSGMNTFGRLLWLFHFDYRLVDILPKNKNHLLGQPLKTIWIIPNELHPTKFLVIYQAQAPDSLQAIYQSDFSAIPFGGMIPEKMDVRISSSWAKHLWFFHKFPLSDEKCSQEYSEAYMELKNVTSTRDSSIAPKQVRRETQSCQILASIIQHLFQLAHFEFIQSVALLKRRTWAKAKVEKHSLFPFPLSPFPSRQLLWKP